VSEDGRLHGSAGGLKRPSLDCAWYDAPISDSSERRGVWKGLLPKVFPSLLVSAARMEILERWRSTGIAGHFPRDSAPAGDSGGCKEVPFGRSWSWNSFPRSAPESSIPLSCVCLTEPEI
jgi:hypothetical protein